MAISHIKYLVSFFKKTKIKLRQMDEKIDEYANALHPKDDIDEPYMSRK